MKVDVVVAGGGMVGSAAAGALAQLGTEGLTGEERGLTVTGVCRLYEEEESLAAGGGSREEDSEAGD